MNRTARWLLLLPLLLNLSCRQTAPLDTCIIPQPQETEPLGGVLNLERPLHVEIESPDSEALAVWIVTTGLPLADPSREVQPVRFPQLRLVCSDDASLPESEEGYRLEITRRGVEILSRGEAGLFYGLQTLQQLYDHYGAELPCLRITDAPRFPYRGLHLDVSRHFFDKEFVKKQLRMMARLKLNRFHWHLTDGAGWRIEIDRYPQLTDVAAWRRGATWQQWRDGGHRYCRRDDPEASGGYYTKADIREVVALADSLHITVIPEIEMPAHSEEVLAVYPELSCTGKPYATGDFCIGNEATFEFLEHVLTEVMELFPSEWIHIGGDECPKQFWKECPHCQRKITELGFDREENPEERLQGWFMREVSNYLGSRGRHIIGWDEILEGDCVGPHDIIMSWRGDKGGITAAGKHIRTIMASEKVLYFDRYQTPGRQQVEPLGFGGCNTLERVYAYDPLASIPAGLEKYVLGCQGSLWTEYVATENHAMHMFLPRAAALAEIQWADPATKDYEAFLRRLPRLLEIYRLYGWTYAPYVLEEIRTLTPENHKTTDKP